MLIAAQAREAGKDAQIARKDERIESDFWQFPSIHYAIFFAQNVNTMATSLRSERSIQDRPEMIANHYGSSAGKGGTRSPDSGLGGCRIVIVSGKNGRTKKPTRLRYDISNP
ncbi:hypothetical protein N2597_22905 (plasmid) [Rhizobium sophoriradicis]|uniref:hypothetical protein n=1 Tax=Rhizobium sophoriradicis TaxID=1535245 RepID=UPI00161FBF7C|nr:hypothetical protein N2597_22905 [Rhizobium leguminosarum bv. phaseoli]